MIKTARIAWKFNAWGGNYPDFENDARLAENMLNQLNLNCFKAPIFMEGGAVHVDGSGTFITTAECLLHPTRNPSLSKQAIEEYSACLSWHRAGDLATQWFS